MFDMMTSYHPVKYIIKQLAIILVKYEWVIMETPVISHVYMCICIYIYMYVHIYMCVCMCVCVCVCVCVRAHVHACLRACVSMHSNNELI